MVQDQLKEVALDDGVDIFEARDFDLWIKLKLGRCSQRNECRER